MMRRLGVPDFVAAVFEFARGLRRELRASVLLQPGLRGFEALCGGVVVERRSCSNEDGAGQRQHQLHKPVVVLHVWPMAHEASTPIESQRGRQ